MNWQVDVGFELASRRHDVISMYPRHVLQCPKDVYTPPWLAPAMRLHTCTLCTAVCHCRHRRLYAMEGTQALSTAGCLLLKTPQVVSTTGCQHHRLSAPQAKYTQRHP